MWSRLCVLFVACALLPAGSAYAKLTPEQEARWKNHAILWKIDADVTFSQFAAHPLPGCRLHFLIAKDVMKGGWGDFDLQVYQAPDRDMQWSRFDFRLSGDERDQPVNHQQWFEERVRTYMSSLTSALVKVRENGGSWNLRGIENRQWLAYRYLEKVPSIITTLPDHLVQWVDFDHRVDSEDLLAAFVLLHKDKKVEVRCMDVPFWVAKQWPYPIEAVGGITD